MQWFEDDRFWRGLYPYMFPAERFELAAEQVSRILILTSLKGGSVLDLCCGPGRHSVEFARRGFSVTGVDGSAFLLQKARERAAESGVEIEWISEDMRRFKRPRAFDIACNLFTSFGYFKDEEDDLRVLRNVHENLKPGGVFVMDILGKERLSRMFQSATCVDFPDGARLVQRHLVLDGWSRLQNEWILLKGGRARTFRFDHAIYSGRELKDRLLQCGFAQVQLFGGLDGGPYGLEASRLVVVARKAPTRT